MSSLQDIERTLDKVGADLWRLDEDFPIDGLVQKLSLIQTQLKVQARLNATAKLLRSHPPNQTLPNQLAIRVKHCIRFTYEDNNHDTDRSSHMRKLDCNALKLCGLTFKTKEFVELPQDRFDFLIQNTGSFVSQKQLIPQLYREDIENTVASLFSSSNDGIKAFLISHIESRPKKRKRDDKEASPTAAQNEHSPSGADRQPKTDTESMTASPKAKRSTSRPETAETALDSASPSQAQRAMKHIYTNSPASQANDLPEPFRTVIQGSRQWKWERSQGLSTTECMTTVFPQDNTQDVSFSIWCAQNDAYRLNDMFGLALAVSS